jgi:hypothetical protein
MAEVIDFKTKISKPKEETIITDVTEDLEIIKVVGKETFIGMCDLLEDMGYDPYSNHQTVKDIESFSFLASALVSRYLNSDHPGTHMLDITGDVIEAMHNNKNIDAVKLKVILKGEDHANNENNPTKN